MPHVLVTVQPQTSNRLKAARKRQKEPIDCSGTDFDRPNSSGKKRLAETFSRQPTSLAPLPQPLPPPPPGWAVASGGVPLQVRGAQSVPLGCATAQGAEHTKGMARGLAHPGGHVHSEGEWRTRVVQEEHAGWVALGIRQVCGVEVLGRKGMGRAAEGSEGYRGEVFRYGRGSTAVVVVEHPLPLSLPPPAPLSVRLPVPFLSHLHPRHPCCDFCHPIEGCTRLRRAMQ